MNPWRRKPRQKQLLPRHKLRQQQQPKPPQRLQKQQPKPPQRLQQQQPKPPQRLQKQKPKLKLELRFALWFGALARDLPRLAQTRAHVYVQPHA